MPVSRLERSHGALLVIDMQERLMPVIDASATCVRRAARLAEAAVLLDVPRLVSEQYRRGLGATVPELAKHLNAGLTAYEDKTRFSAHVGKIAANLEARGVRSVVLVGVEAHICVLHTALDLLDAGYAVAVCEDAVGSRRDSDKAAALRRMVQAGAVPTTVESVMCEWCGDAGSDRFKAIRGLLVSAEGA